MTNICMGLVACLILVETTRLVPFKAECDIVDKALGWHQLQAGAATGVIFLSCASISQTDKRESNAKLLCKEL